MFIEKTETPECPCFNRKALKAAIKAIMEDIDSVYFDSFREPSTDGSTHVYSVLRVFPHGSTPSDIPRGPHLCAAIEGAEYEENPEYFNFYYCDRALNLDDFTPEWWFPGGMGFPSYEEGPVCTREIKATINWIKNKYPEYVYG